MKGNMQIQWHNIKQKMPRHNEIVLGYYEVWGTYRPSGEET